MIEVAILLLAVPAAAAATWAGAAVALVGSVPTRPGEGPYDAVIVPGARVLPDGTPSAALARRVQAACALVQDGLAPVIVISGAGGGPRTEAEVGATLARAAGLPDHVVRLEPLAHRTAANAARTADLLGRQARVLVVTERWHGARARLWFRRHFDQVDVVGVDAPLRPTLRGALTECPKWVVQRLG